MADRNTNTNANAHLPNEERVDPAAAGPADARRRPEAAGRVLVVILVCLALWAVAAAPSLKASAEASPYGARRTAALVLLTPLADLSRLVGLAKLNSLAETALGRPDPMAPPPTIPPLKPIKRHVHPTALPPLRKPTRADPLRVLVIGDSTALDLGYGLQRAASPTGRYKVILDGRISTGLARLDYFNWLAQAQRDMIRYHPDVVVVLLGLNDLQDFRTGGRYMVRFTRPWLHAYATRVDALLAELSPPERRVVWVGEPIVSNKDIAYGLRIVNRVYRNQTGGISGVSYLDSWHLFVDAKRRYTAYLRDSSGNLEQVREADGEHLTPAGQDRIGQYVFAYVKTLSRPPSASATPPPSGGRSSGPKSTPAGTPPA
jgi:uncharacterized protein